MFFVYNASKLHLFFLSTKFSAYQLTKKQLFVYVQYRNRMLCAQTYVLIVGGMLGCGFLSRVSVSLME